MDLEEGDKQLVALDICIKTWKKRKLDTQSVLEVRTCALCILNDNCNDCIICKVTGLRGCNATPYMAYVRAEGDKYFRQDEATEIKRQNAAQEMIDMMVAIKEGTYVKSEKDGQ